MYDRAVNAAGSTRLSLPERMLAAAVGIVAAVLALLALTDPPNVTQAAPAAACKNVSECTVAVAADTKTLVVALALLSGAALLIALLGIRFTKITAGSVSLEEGTVGEVSKDEAKSRTQNRLTTDAPVEAPGAVANPHAWESLPTWAKNTLLLWATSGTALTTPLRSAVVSAEKESGRGNRPWYVTVRLDSGETRTLRLATGKGSHTVRHDEPDDG